MHHVRMMEFMWNVVDPREFPDGNMLKIYDIKGISMADMSSDVVNYTKKWGEVIATYNPERVYQVFIINPPAWFNLIWKLVSPLVNPKTRERIHVLRGQKTSQRHCWSLLPRRTYRRNTVVSASVKAGASPTHQKRMTFVSGRSSSTPTTMATLTTPSSSKRSINSAASIRSSFHPGLQHRRTSITEWYSAMSCSHEVSALAS